MRVDNTALISSLIDPAKLDTLKGDRAANTRLRKIVYWLEVSRRQGEDPAELIGNAQAHAGYGGTARAREDKKALLRNLTILERLGCLTEDGMAKLRKGNAPTITRSPYAGGIVEVDHIIPRNVAPELDEKLYNLEFMTKTMNRRKSDTLGDRQRTLAKEWAREGLLSPAGLKAVETEGQEGWFYPLQMRGVIKHTDGKPYIIVKDGNKRFPVDQEKLQLVR